MKIGTLTQKRMQVYNLTAQEVYFAELLHAGATKLEAYCLIYPQINDSPQVAAKRLITQSPGIWALVNALALTQPTDNRQASKRPTDKGKGKVKQKINITTKDGQLQELRKIYEETTDNKARADLLKQISDLQQLKHEQSTEEEQRVHYYLPIRCDICPYKPTKQPTEDGNSPEKVI